MSTPRHSFYSRIFVALLILLVAGCSTRADRGVAEGGSQSSGDEEMPLAPTDSGWEPLRTVKGEPLSEAEIRELLARLPDLEVEEGDEVSFKRREESLLPPLTGEDLKEGWPPDLSQPKVQVPPSGSLKVQAFRPTGEARPPFQVAIAFDRPVVEVGAVLERPIPELSIEPAVDGRWRWVGAQTLVFEPAKEWPMATDYQVRLAPGLKSVEGSALKEELSFEFSTPAPTVRAIYPGKGQTRAADEPVVILFDQRIDGETARSVEVLANSKSHPMRLLEGAEKEEAIKKWSEDGELNERVLAFAPVEEYPASAQVKVKVKAPIASLEGPILGTVGEEGEFRVRGPFEIVEFSCGYGDCRPGAVLSLVFSNQIDRGEGAPVFQTKPAVENLSAQVYGNRVHLSGDFQPYTTYEVIAPSELKDIFGQPVQGSLKNEATFVGHRPFVSGPNSMVVVRPAGGPMTLPVMMSEVGSVRARVYSAGPENWGEFQRFVSNSRVEAPWGEPAATQTFSFSKEERRSVQEVAVDLSAALKESATGHAIVVLDRPEPWPYGEGSRWPYWVQRTDLAAQISSDMQALTVQVTSLATGEPVAGATMSFDGKNPVTTDKAGEARIELPGEELRRRPLQIEKDGDRLLIPVDGDANWLYERREWSQRRASTSLLWYVVGDRQIYKPGEEVRIRGWVRAQEQTPRSTPKNDLEGATVRYVIRESRGNEIEQGERVLDGFGGFEVGFEIPEGANLGHGSIELTLKGEVSGTTYQSFEVQEFRRPEYEVSLESKRSVHLAGEESYLEGQAAYYAGGALVGAPALWRFQESPGRFEPAGWSGWQFGRWSPWWWRPFGASGVDDSKPQVLPERLQRVVEGKTDHAGLVGMTLPFEVPSAGFPRNIRAILSVSDVNRQSWEATTDLLVHPAQVYVGLRAKEAFVQRGQPWEVELVAVDLDGKIVQDRPVQVEIKRERSGEEEVVKACAKTSGGEPISCSFADLSPGMYRAVATVEDGQGRRSESHLNFWVAGQDRRGAQVAEEDQLLLIPDKDSYAVGDRAKILVQAPYYPLKAVLELRRDGRYERRHVEILEEDPTVSIDIEEGMIPNIHVNLQALGGGEAYGLDAFAAGEVELKVERERKRLDVEVVPAAEAISPGESLEVEVIVKDSGEEAVKGAQVLLFAVDEAILSLSDYRLADPLEAFFPDRAAQMMDIQSRQWLLLPSEEDLLQDPAMMGRGGAAKEEAALGGPVRMAAPMARSMSADSAAGFGGSGRPEPIALREVFDALAFFESDLITDGEGRVKLRATMPESLTRYRIMAVAVDGDDRFGHGEEDVTARLPLMVRPSEPRFLNVGDEFELPVVVQNQTLEPMTVDVALRAGPNLEWIYAPGQRVEVPAADRVEVRFPARALMAGQARVQVAAAAGVHGDAALVDFPILTPATTEAFATYGSLSEEDAILQALQIPEDAYAEYGGLELGLSSTELQALTDAFIYLVDYPFGWSEHLASRILSVLALQDVLQAFEAPGLPAQEVLEERLDQWIQRLVQMQLANGGFGFWEGADRASPFVTVHAAYALYQAERAGRRLPAGSLEGAHRYLSQISSYLRDYRPRQGATVEAYALYVRHRMAARFGEVAPREVDGLITSRGMEELSLEALGWLLPLVEGTQWEERMMQRIMNQAQETAATAEFQETYAQNAYQILHTARRTDGVILDSLLQVQPNHPLVEKVARGLLAHRERGRWSNTQENVFIVMALRRYFDEYESVTPDFIARAWLGEEQIGEHTFKGRTTERYGVDVPMGYLKEGDPVQPVVIQRDGEGRLYYRFGVSYAPKSRHLPPLDEGFHVERVYRAVDDEEDVKQDEEGNWVIRAGARVQVELVMTVPARRYHVALVDWLPAGFEPINTALAVSDVEPGLVGGSRVRPAWPGWWGWRWYEHENMRDERVEAFASMVARGTYTYSYLARATTPGVFIAMPAKAEELYHPETFGRSATEVVKVVD